MLEFSKPTTPPESQGLGLASYLAEHVGWTPRIMIADDISANILALTYILKHGGYTNVVSTTDGRAVVETFETTQPDILLLDLHMPSMDGLAAIAAIRELTSRSGWVPIVVLTGDGSMDARRNSLSAGASDFIGKPYDMTEVVLRVQNLLETRRLQLALARENETLERRVQERTDELLAARIDGLQRLAIATEQRDDDTGEHTRRVGTLAASLAEQLGVQSTMVEAIRTTAPLHDIGKIAIPDAILNKPGKLTEEEYAIMKTHTIAGGAILAGGTHQLMVTAERIVLTHHEWWNGAGYPLGLRGEDIPLEGRITAVADFYDALSHNRVYRPAVPHAEVLGMIAKGSGVQFDPAIADAMLSIGSSLAPAMEA